MTLVSSGAISCNSINTEIGAASNALITLNDATPRNLAGRPVGYQVIYMSDFYGKSWGVPAGAISPPSTPMAGFSWTNLAYAVDGNATTYATLIADGTSSSSYGTYTTAAVTCNKSKVTATVTWGGTITGASQVFIKYSTNNGTTWINSDALNKSASWASVTETIFSLNAIAIPSYIRFYIGTYSSTGGKCIVYLNDIKIIML